MNPRKIISLNLDVDVVQRIDQYVVRPCSRSDLVNDVLVYMMQNSGILEHFVREKNSQLQSCANNE